MNSTKSVAKIAGISACVPKFKYSTIDYPHLTKDKLKKFIKITGIKERRIAKYSQLCTSDLAIKASKKLMQDLDWNRKDIDFLIFISQTTDYLTPATSIIIQNKLGLKKSVYTLDINLGCSGFAYGISNSFSLIKNFNFKKGLFIIGDTLSQICNIKDQSTWPLFGDGCGAIGIEKGKKMKKTFFDFHTDGSGYKDIIVPSHSLSGRNPLKINDFNNKNKDGVIKSNINMSLNGPNIFSFSTTVMPKKLRELIYLSKTDPNKIKYCFLHQANKLINDTIIEKLDLKKTIFPSSIKRFGNTSSATIPITVVKQLGGKKISGTTLFSGFGVGLSAANMIYNFDNCKISKLTFFDE